MRKDGYMALGGMDRHQEERGHHENGGVVGGKSIRLGKWLHGVVQGSSQGI